MSTDKLFILLLVVLLPLSGCLDTVEPAGADAAHSDAEIEINNPPVIYGELRFWDYYDYDTSTLYEDVLVVQGMTKDFDGVIVQFGVDTDLDGNIDFNLSNPDTYHLQMIDTNGTGWMNPVMWNPTGHTMDAEYCYQWIQLISVDDDGAKQINPVNAIFELDGETDQCTLEHN